MGLSLGISPIPSKVCNYSCVYCQLGKTVLMSNEREEFFKLNDILKEIKEYLTPELKFDVVTIVGEGEPTLYLKLGKLIEEIKKLTDKPIALITNGSLLYDKSVREECCKVDIILPTLDAYNEETYRQINRPYGKLKYKDFFKGLVEFSKIFKGQLWLEVMLVKGINDDLQSLFNLKDRIDQVNFDRVYINVPARPPAELWVKIPSKEHIDKAIEILGGISIESLVSYGFQSNIKDSYEAILSIIKRHPMNNFEILTFLQSRNENNITQVFDKLEHSDKIEKIKYKGYVTYRTKNER